MLPHAPCLVGVRIGEGARRRCPPAPDCGNLHRIAVLRKGFHGTSDFLRGSPSSRYFSIWSTNFTAPSLARGLPDARVPRRLPISTLHCSRAADMSSRDLLILAVSDPLPGDREGLQGVGPRLEVRSVPRGGIAGVELGHDPAEIDSNISPERYCTKLTDGTH